MVTPAQYAQLVAALVGQAGGPELAKHQRQQQSAPPHQQQQAPAVAARPSWMPDPNTAIPWYPPGHVPAPPLKIPPGYHTPPPPEGTPGPGGLPYAWEAPGWEEWEPQGNQNRNRIIGQADAPDEPPMRWPNVIDPRGIPEGWPYPYKGPI